MGTIFDNQKCNIDISLFKKDNPDPKTSLRRHYLSLVGLLQYVDILNGDAEGELPEGITEEVVTGMINHGIGDLDTRRMTGEGGDEPTPEPEPSPVPSKPEVTPNTEEQQAVADAAVESIAGGETNIQVQGLNNITIPADTTKAITLQGTIVDGATIRNESTKSTTVKNEGDPVSVTFDTKGDDVDGSVSLTGEYNDIYTDSGIGGVSAGLLAGTEYATVHGDITIDENCKAAKSISAVFTDGEDDKEHKIATNSDLNGKVLTITNSVPKDAETTTPNIQVYAPNASVTLNGNYDQVEMVCSDNTLKLGSKFHCNTLVLNRGRFLVDFLEDEMPERIGELVINDGASMEYASTEITASKLTGLTSVFSGKAKVMEDIELTNKSMVPGVVASNHEELDLNGHTVQMGRTDSGCMMLRGSIRMDIIDSVGGGKLVNNAESYGVWAAAEGVVINIRGGRFEAYTHVMYAQKGVINIYGGEFKMLGDADVDEKGHYKFLLNCYDASYQEGTAKINVYGGKFYNFNPAESYGEPNGPVNFVAEGYKSVMTIEDGVEVFTVVPNDTPDPNPGE